MNNRMKLLKRYYCSILTKIESEPEFTYTVSNNEATTEFYYGTKASVTVPNILDEYPVTKVGNTTFSLGALKVEDFEKPDVRNRITNIVFSDGIEKI